MRSECDLDRRADSRTRRDARGYTVVEVLMAMVLMAIGTAAVMSMQKASVQGNLDARKTDLANSIARTWIDRLQRDAMAWTQGANSTATASLSQTTQMLATLINNGGAWDFAAPMPSAIANTPLSPCYDIFGRELDSTNWGNAQFCVHARAVYLSPAQDLLRVDVRVVWLRGMTPVGGTAPAAVTDPALAKSNSPSSVSYHAVYATTAVMESPAQGGPSQGTPIPP
jgi:prepilin-type N-terminal cleavage/methylation domain-containing protein